MEPSEEIRRIIERWTRAHSEGDRESALQRWSDLPDTLIIGNDADECWHGDEGRAIWARQLEELGAFPLTSYEVEAWEEGSVGWASVKETITSPGSLGGSFDGRSTYVLHLERGEWKVVHVHWSVAKPNIEFLGRTLTTSLEELERSVQREQPDLSSTLAADGTVTIENVPGARLLVGAIVVIGLLAAGIVAASLPRAARSTSRAEVLVSGETPLSLDLSQDGVHDLLGPIGVTRIEVHGGKVRVLSSPCARQVCRHGGSIGEPGELLVCLPNEIEIRVPGEPRRGPDATSR